MRDVMPMNVDDHLDEVLGIVEKPKKEVVKAGRFVPVITNDDSGDSEIDFQYARENLYNLIERGQDGLEEMLEIAKSSEHPRAMEVFGQLIGKLTDTNKELLNLHKTKKDISQDTSGPKNVSNNLFVGSTAELQKFLKKGRGIKENEKELYKAIYTDFKKSGLGYRLNGQKNRYLNTRSVWKILCILSKIMSKL